MRHIASGDFEPEDRALPDDLGASQILPGRRPSRARRLHDETSLGPDRRQHDRRAST